MHVAKKFRFLTQGLVDVMREMLCPEVTILGGVMSEFLPKEVREGLEKARKAALGKKNRLKVCADGVRYPVLRFWAGGFALDAENAPALRGLVDVYDGTRHLYQALIVASHEEGGALVFGFKRVTAAVDKAPLDFYRAPDAPVALLR